MTVIPASSLGVQLPDAAQAASKLRIVDDENQVQKDMFLKLMIAQLRNQDPTAPMDQKDMMAAMTQFSQVEQMQNITRAMETLSMAQGVNMIGQVVDYRVVMKNSDGSVGSDEVRSGRVVAVEQKAGGVELTLENGVRVKPVDVTSVSATGSIPQTMVGKFVSYDVLGTDASGQTRLYKLGGRVTSVEEVDGKAMLNVSGHLFDPAERKVLSNIPLDYVSATLPPGVTEA